MLSPVPEPIATSSHEAFQQRLYRELALACEGCLTLDVSEKPAEFTSLPTDTRKLYIAIRMHCETCITESARYIETSWSDFRLVAISLKLIERLDTEVLVQDVSKLTELMLTLRASLEGWVDTLVPGVGRSFFIEASMTRWDGLHAEMPIASPSAVPSPSQDPAYLARLVAEAGGAAVAPAGSDDVSDVYPLSPEGVDDWLASLTAFSERRVTPPRQYVPRPAATDPDLLSPGDIGSDLLRRAFSDDPETRRIEGRYSGVTSVRKVLSANPAWNEEVTPHPLALQIEQVERDIALQKTILESVSEQMPFMVNAVEEQIAALEAAKARLEAELLGTKPEQPSPVWPYTDSEGGDRFDYVVGSFPSSWMSPDGHSDSGRSVSTAYTAWHLQGSPDRYSSSPST